MNFVLTLICLHLLSSVCDIISVSGDTLEHNNGVYLTESSDEALQYPYKVGETSRVKRDCEHNAYGHKTSSMYTAHGIGKGGISGELTLPIVETKTTTYTIAKNRYNERDALLHIAYVNNPVTTVSVYEPLHDGTCKYKNLTLSEVRKTALPRHCLLATNAGLFKTRNGACYGNIVSDGRLVKDTKGLQNAHFGITKAGQLFFGYLSEIDLVTDDFLQLVGGVIWVLRDGKVHVDESITSECQDTEETGTLQLFASVISARTLVGHDDQGRVMILQIEGKTDRFGANLYEAARILKDLGAINAINLDGGGSSTLVINNTLVNHPSDVCFRGRYTCPRKVSTILCVHEPHCSDKECGGHGACELGRCHCHGHWAGENCDRLECPGDCYGHGACAEIGCVCVPGYHGKNCSASCSDGWYGNQCERRCQCENNATCDTITGRCACQPGYTGPLCQYKCKLGFYGDQCSSKCECEEMCTCDPVSGACNYTYTEEDYVQAGPCFTKKLQQKRDVEFEMVQQYKSAIVTVIVIAAISFLSVTLNIILIYKSFSTCNTKDARRTYKRARSSNGNAFLFHGKPYSSFTSSSASDDNDETALIEKPKDLPS